VKPANRSAAPYTFFAQVYRDHPIVDVVEFVRDNKLSGLSVACNRTNSSDDLQVPIALDPSLHEQLLSATAEFVDTDKTRDPVPPEVKKIDPAGIAHVFYSARPYISGPDIST
jgi:hypothetical protein